MRKRTHRLQAGSAVAVVLAALLVSAAAAQTPAPPWAARVDRLFASWDRPDSPGCALGVFRDGRIAYERGYGTADIEQDVRIVPDTVFYVGSLSKQFTAMAAALAIDRGRLSADDPVRKYLPELPAYADGITVRHLVHHTSGLRDYNTLLSIAGRRGDEAYDNRTVLRITARQKDLNFAPGTEYLYSNTGYTLLATVVERATGTPFAEFAAAQIFTPLGMAATHYGVDVTRLVPRRAAAYARGADGRLRLDTPRNERAGAGGVYTTVRDLLRWDENFYDARVGGRGLIDRIQVPGVLSNGTPISYAWGLQISTYRGLRVVEHGGSLGGYRAHLTRFPDQHVSVAILCNLGSIAPSALVRQVADVVLADRLGDAAPDSTAPAPRAAPSPAAGAGAASNLQAFVGAYYSDEIDATFTVAIDGGQLVLRREDETPAPLEPLGDGRFRSLSLTIRFEPSALVVDAGRVRGIRFARKPL
jgi:CubicO group peptidase (beta-lactamase class C family)